MDLFHHFEREKKEKIEKLKYVRSIMFYENVIFVNVFESQLMLHFFGEKVKDLEKERFSYEHFCSLDVMSNPAPWSINGSSPENSEVSQVFDLKTQNNFPTVIKLSHYVK